VAQIVGFDLDMTLLDTRAGIAAAFRELSRRTGVTIDTDLVVGRLGPPLRTEMAYWFPAEGIEDAVTLYRALYETYAIAPAVALPGAVASIDAVHRAGGKVVVITSKLGRLAELHLRHLRLDVDAVHGDVFAEQKGEVLKAVDAFAMVGDHVADMRAGLVAGVHRVGVTTGPCSAAELEAAGAEWILPGLQDFPTWWRDHDLSWPPGER
jgi:phosphoglycolate phosphatase